MAENLSAKASGEDLSAWESDESAEAEVEHRAAASIVRPQSDKSDSSPTTIRWSARRRSRRLRRWRRIGVRHLRRPSATFAATLKWASNDGSSNPFRSHASARRWRSSRPTRRRLELREAAIFATFGRTRGHTDSRLRIRRQHTPQASECPSSPATPCRPPLKPQARKGQRLSGEDVPRTSIAHAAMSPTIPHRRSDDIGRGDRANRQDRIQPVSAGNAPVCSPSATRVALGKAPRGLAGCHVRHGEGPHNRGR